MYISLLGVTWFATTVGFLIFHPLWGGRADPLWASPISPSTRGRPVSELVARALPETKWGFSGGSSPRGGGDGRSPEGVGSATHRTSSFALYKSTSEIPKSVGDLCVSLLEIHKSSREICISFTDLHKSPEKIGISLGEIPISFSPTTQGARDLRSAGLNLARVTSPRPRFCRARSDGLFR